MDPCGLILIKMMMMMMMMMMMIVGSILFVHQIVTVSAISSMSLRESDTDFFVTTAIVC